MIQQSGVIMKKIILLFLIGFTLSIPVLAQSTIAGKVTESASQPLPYTSVLLLNAHDSAYVNGSVTDGEGAFRIIEKKSGAYILSIKSMGNVPYYRNVTLQDKDVDLGTITLTADAKVLKEVSVIGTKKLIEFSGDKMVMDLSVSPVTSGLNAFELLSKVPGVSINAQSQAIQMVGKTGVLVMIDGRPTNLSGDELAAMLKSMKSDEFEKVEVITNPSAKYEAQGASGIINLKTKTGKMYGTNYILNLGGGYSYYKEYGSYPKYNEGFSVNVKRGKYTAYINLNHSRNTDLLWTEETRSFLDNTKSIYQKQYYTELDKGENQRFSGRLNLDFYLFKKTAFGFSLSGSSFDGNKKARLEQKIDNGSDNNLYNIYTDKRRSDDLLFSYANAHLKHTFDTAGTELTMDVDLIFNYINNRYKFYQNRFSANSNEETFNSLSTITDPHSYIVRLSFEKKLSSKTQLETGYSTRVSIMKNDFSNDFVPIDSLQHSIFNFLENINSGYAILRTVFNHQINLEAGLRAEHTYTNGSNEFKRKLSRQNYINFFPSFSLNKKITSTAFSIGYSRRIGRLDARNFNLFKQFYSPLHYMVGNPTLTASLNNTYNASVTMKDKYFMELSYTNRKNEIIEIMETDTVLIPGYSLSASTNGNAKGKVSWWALKGYIPIDINKVWRINVQLNGGINDYNYTFREARTKIKQWFWAVSCQQTFLISETLSAEINGWVNSGETYGFQNGKLMGTVDFGISQKIFKKNGSIRLSLQDPFNLYNYRMTYTYDYLTGADYFRWDNRSILLNFSYNFGNRNVNVRSWESKFRSADEGKK